MFEGNGSGETLYIAAPIQAREALNQLSASGRIPIKFSVVELDDEGKAPPDQAPLATVLWRHGRVSRKWAQSALACLGNLRWAHSDYVGVDGLPLADLRSRSVVLTNGLGNYSRPMAEWVLLAMLGAVKRFPQTLRQSQAAIWKPLEGVEELDGKVALLLGLGSVNALVAPMISALGVKVSALVRSERRQVPLGVDQLVTGEKWRDLLPQVDFLVLGLPQTPQTERIIDEAVLASLKQGAWLINVARGGLVDDSALVASLNQGHLGGALLDAFDKEPLPSDHPLWKASNAIIVPHSTWASPKVAERIDELFFSQLLRFVNGEELENVVDLEAGY